VFLRDMKKAEGKSFGFVINLLFGDYHWTWKSLVVRAGAPWTVANWLPLPKPASAPLAL
jgi:hypothetical protein